MGTGLQYCGRSVYFLFGEELVLTAGREQVWCWISEGMLDFFGSVFFFLANYDPELEGLWSKCCFLSFRGLCYSSQIFAAAGVDWAQYVITVNQILKGFTFEAWFFFCWKRKLDLLMNENDRRVLPFLLLWFHRYKNRYSKKGCDLWLNVQTSDPVYCCIVLVIIHIRMLKAHFKTFLTVAIPFIIHGMCQIKCSLNFNLIFI